MCILHFHARRVYLQAAALSDTDAGASLGSRSVWREHRLLRARLHVVARLEFQLGL